MWEYSLNQESVRDRWSLRFVCGSYNKNVGGSVDSGPLHSPGGGGGGGYLAKFNTGGSASRSNPLPFYISFWQKRYLFYIPFIKKRYLFHMPTLEHCTPFYALVIKSLNEQYYGSISRISRRNAISASIRNILIKGPLKYLNDRFPNPFIYLNL